MNQDERKKFWDVLLTMHDAEPEHIQKLHETITVPHKLCRFRSVSESSLAQLQENRLYFSTADYYDDPFDTYFYVDYRYLENLLLAINSMMKGQDGEKAALNILSMCGFSSDAAQNSLKLSAQNPLTIQQLQVWVENVHSQILKTLYTICFCEDPLNETLWLKYADNHRGFVIVYDFYDGETDLCRKEAKCAKCLINLSPPSLYPVYYSDAKYDATRYAMALLLKDSLSCSNIPIPEIFKNAIYSRSLWEIERVSLIKKSCHAFDGEWRMICSQLSTSRPSIKLKPKSVFIGLRTPQYKERLIISAATVAGIKDIRKIQINRKDELEAVPIETK